MSMAEKDLPVLLIRSDGCVVELPELSSDDTKALIDRIAVGLWPMRKFRVNRGIDHRG
jgi:hypothetical protein